MNPIRKILSRICLEYIWIEPCWADIFNVSCTFFVIIGLPICNQPFCSIHWSMTFNKSSQASRQQMIEIFISIGPSLTKIHPQVKKRKLRQSERHDQVSTELRIVAATEEIYISENRKRIEHKELSNKNFTTAPRFLIHKFLLKIEI